MKNETKNRLLRALALRGHTYFSGPGMRIFFILQIILQLYLLEPVFIYYFKGVPPETSLEVIAGTWRTEGQLGSNSNGLTAPKYFVDTEQGSREVHCGFPVQRRPCSIFGIASPPLGIQVSVKYDNYFGILSFDAVDLPAIRRQQVHMSYREGVLLYAQPEHTIYHNYKAHWMFLCVIALYALSVTVCWHAQKPSVTPNDSVQT